ncbi:MAG TPA: S1C family serine protease [Xanthobacteraceae bacterium]|nr:S1C family serine protease [Xanthobacteraceae bacterium]
MTQSTQFGQVQDLSAAFARLVGVAAPSIGAIKSAHSQSSGFFWRPGLIVTAEEALSEEGDVTVTLPSGESLAAQLVGRDHTTDIAVLRVERSDLPPVQLETKPVPIGALAIVVGAEDGAPTAAFGVVSRSIGPWWSLRGGEINARIELDLRMRRSAEGGLALDATGRAMGMTVFGPRRRVLVIPSATIERVAARLEKHGHIPRGYLGLGFQLVAVEGGGRGIMVMNVEPQGPGAKADVRQGDIIVSWNGEPIGHVRSLLRALGPDSVGQTVTLGLRRGGETRNVPLTIAERPTA